MTNDIKNIIKKYNIKLVMPENAKSWQCDWKNCGLCCITEKSDYYEKKKCSKFNSKTKECKIYNKRPLNCKIFPYMIIFNQNGINLSPSLLCPGVSNPSELDDLNVLDILTDKDFIEFIIFYSENFLGYCADFNLKISNDLTFRTSLIKHNIFCIHFPSDSKYPTIHQSYLPLFSQQFHQVKLLIL